jgi:hypothetical protein
MGVKERLSKEFISGGSLAALAAIRQALPQYCDDVSRDYGGDIYDKMQTDADAGPAFQTLKLAILADGVNIAPAVEMPSDTSNAKPDEIDEAEQAKEYADFIRRCFDGADRSISDIADELLDGLAYGNKISEIVLKPGTGEDSGRLVLKAVKGKNWRNVAYVVDPFMEVQGVLGATPEGLGIVQGCVPLTGDLMTRSDFLPPYKYIAFRNGGKDGDPRGSSVFRSAYNAWFIKTQVIPEYYKYLRQFASPGIIGKTAQNGDGLIPVADANGHPVVDENNVPQLIKAEYQLYTALLAWINASVLVVPYGTEIDLLKSEGTGDAFLSANDYFGRQIVQAILGTDGMTMGAKNDSKGAKETGQDVVGLRVSKGKNDLGECLTRGLIRMLILVNFGEEAMKLCPKAILTKAEQQDWAKELDALSKAYGTGFIHESQLQALDTRLGLPPRDMEQVAVGGWRSWERLQPVRHARR